MVTAWRQRERLLRRAGVDLTLVTAVRWEEGGALVPFTPAGDEFALAAPTLGRHPNLFLFDPRPLWRLLGDGRWDVIDLHEEPFGLAVAEVLVLRWLRARRTPYLVSSAQNIDKRYPAPFRWLERWSLRGAAGAYTCNTEAGAILRRKGLTGALELLPLGVDVLLRAVALDARLDADVYGAGPEAAGLEALADDLGISGRVTFHGHVDEATLPDVFPTFDVLAVPSVPVPGWLEQFGRVVVEGQASGIPAVASNSGALPEVVGAAGLLVPPSDPRALAASLARMLDEPGLWERLRRAGTDTVGRYSWSSVADRQHDLYLRVAGRG